MNLNIKSCQGDGDCDTIPDTMTSNTSPATTPVTATTKADDKTPIVEFEYPDSETGEMKLRYLRVVEADSRYVKGYELISPISKTDGQFKTFSRTRLARYGVHLISF
jgi:hypothetical protein